MLGGRRRFRGAQARPFVTSRERGEPGRAAAWPAARGLRHSPGNLLLLLPPPPARRAGTAAPCKKTKMGRGSGGKEEKGEKG